MAKDKEPSFPHADLSGGKWIKMPEFQTKIPTLCFVYYANSIRYQEVFCNAKTKLPANILMGFILLRPNLTFQVYFFPVQWSE